MSGKINVRSRSFIDAPFILPTIYVQKHGANYINAYPGEKYGQLTILEDLGSYIKDGCKTPVHYVRCICDCGNIVEEVSLTKLKSGHTKSCGCLSEKHGLSKDRLYKIRRAMIERCYYPPQPCYPDYGGRGIQICEEWLNKDNGFINFYNWAISNGYKDGLSIDRIDVNGDYEPSNCKWSTPKEQMRNRRNTIFLTYKGETRALGEWAEITGIYYDLLLRRYKSGWTADQIIETPIRKKKGNKQND